MLEYDGGALYGEGLLSSEAMDSQARRTRRLAASEALLERLDSSELGFDEAPDTETAPIEAFAKERLSEEWTDQVVIGIGGSSLGAEAVLRSARPHHRRGLRTHFADNLDPESVDRLFSQLDLRTTLLVVVTKSGTTIETMSQFWIARQLLEEAVGAKRAHRHVVAITDPEDGALRRLVNQEGWYSFDIPPNVGGRFSVLTPVGLVPLALAGYPIEPLLKGARQVRDRYATAEEIADSLGRMADEALALAEAGYGQVVMMTYGDRLVGLVDWFRQLWAESLGKAHQRDGEQVHRGITPVFARGVVDQHSQVQLYMEGPKDKWVCFLEVEEFARDRRVPDSPALPEGLEHLGGTSVSDIFAAELEGTRRALQESGRPTASWRFQKVVPKSVGGFLYAWQMITGVAGELWQVNAFDQPGVELGKKIAHGLLGREEYGDLAAKRPRRRTVKVPLVE